MIHLQKIDNSSAHNAGVNLYMARADEIHPLASGNKFYKLSPIIEYAKKNNFQQLLSFGGAYSNHIHALALLAKENNMKSIGIVRGEADSANPTLQDVQTAGMQLEFISREAYRNRNDPAYLEDLQKRFPEALIIPEGGSSQQAIAGCAQLASDINSTFESDVITIACGTGATLAGLACGQSNNQKVIGYSVLKDKSLETRVQQFLASEDCPNSNYKIESADFGGYAKLDKQQLNFIFDWLDKTGILLDPIYTSKMCMRLMQQIEAGEFKSGTSITMIHSGGLQGWRGMQKRVIGLMGELYWEKIEAYIGSR